MTPLRQRLGIVLQHLAAHGRTTVVKGCRDPANRGWRRSPLGGSGGMQYYLWWTVQGSAPARDITFPGCGGVLVRAVRHHDDHGRLDAGVLDDYLPFSQHEIIVQSGPTQSTRRLHMEMGTPTPSSPFSFRNQGHHSRSRESAPNSTLPAQPASNWSVRSRGTPQRISVWLMARERERSVADDRATHKSPDGDAGHGRDRGRFDPAPAADYEAGQSKPEHVAERRLPRSSQPTHSANRGDHQRDAGQAAGPTRYSHSAHVDRRAATHGVHPAC